MKNTFVRFLLFATLSIMFFSCTKEDNGTDNPKEELKEVEDVCTQMNDINFMSFCYTNFDVNKDGKVSMIEANAVYKMDVSRKNIQSLTGIEYFTNLTELDCGFNDLTSLDITKCVNLTVLSCTLTKLTSLDVTKCINLKELYCGYNDLTSLDITKCVNLKELYCFSNDLTSLDVTKCANLKVFNCSFNKLTSLDVSMCANLTELDCSYNELTSLDVSMCANLTELDCNYNPLTIIYMHTKHKNINCSYPKGVNIEYLDL